jgi:hypothetical protein
MIYRLTFSNGTHAMHVLKDGEHFEDSLLTYAFTQLYSVLSGGELFLSSRYLRSDRKASLGRAMC